MQVFDVTNGVDCLNCAKTDTTATSVENVCCVDRDALGTSDRHDCTLVMSAMQRAI